MKTFPILERTVRGYTITDDSDILRFFSEEKVFDYLIGNGRHDGWMKVVYQLPIGETNGFIRRMKEYDASRFSRDYESTLSKLIGKSYEYGYE